MSTITTEQALDAFVPENTPYNRLPTLTQAFKAVKAEGVDVDVAAHLTKMVQQTAGVVVRSNYFKRHPGGVSGMSYSFTQNADNGLGISMTSSIEAADLGDVRAAVAQKLTEEPDTYGIEVLRKPLTKQAQNEDTGLVLSALVPAGA